MFRYFLSKKSKKLFENLRNPLNFFLFNQNFGQSIDPDWPAESRLLANKAIQIFCSLDFGFWTFGIRTLVNLVRKLIKTRLKMIRNLSRLQRAGPCVSVNGKNLVGVAAVGQLRYKHDLPDLPYDYNALEPTISADIMKIHHSKHHATYVTNLNAAEEKLAEAKGKNDISTIIQLGGALKFNGGGHLNHSIFWKNLSPKGGGEPAGELMEAIKRDFGSFDNFKTRLSTASVGIQGSGWGWLGFNKTSKRLEVATCANQDPLEATLGLVPLFGIDVWEHAYYLQYKNVRADYVKNIFNIANWTDVGQRFSGCK